MNVPEHLHDLMVRELADEPSYLLDPDAALAGGRRRRRTRTAILGVVAGATGAVLLSGALALQPDGPAGRQTLLGATPPAVASAPPGEIERIVRAHTPSNWTITEVHEFALDSFEADVDDGDGASRLYIGVSPSPGSLQQHPCSDHEFAGGGSCKEIELDADTRLILRGPAASGPVVSAYVIIVHRDGSGVDVGNDSATWEWIGDEVAMPVTPEQKRHMTTPSINRSGPVYSMGQLVEIAKEVDASR